MVDQLRKDSGRLWADATDHPFITELGDGSLPEDKFRRYFMQDYVFVNQLAKVGGLAVAKAPDLVAARPFGDFLSVLLGAEDTLFLDAFEVMQVPESEYRNAMPLPTTDAFSNYLVGLASAGTFADICCAMYVVEGVYLDLGTGSTGRMPGLPIQATPLEACTSSGSTSTRTRTLGHS